MYLHSIVPFSKHYTNIKFIVNRLNGQFRNQPPAGNEIQVQFTLGLIALALSDFVRYHLFRLFLECIILVKVHSHHVIRKC